MKEFPLHVSFKSLKDLLKNSKNTIFKPYFIKNLIISNSLANEFEIASNGLIAIICYAQATAMIWNFWFLVADKHKMRAIDA